MKIEELEKMELFVERIYFPNYRSNIHPVYGTYQDYEQLDSLIRNKVLYFLKAGIKLKDLKEKLLEKKDNEKVK